MPRKTTNQLWQRFLDNRQGPAAEVQELDDAKKAKLQKKLYKQLNQAYRYKYCKMFLKFANWDLDQAFMDVQSFRDATDGILYPPAIATAMEQQGTVLKGFQNDRGTSCYIDALLFAMYMGLVCFDPMLLGEPFDPRLLSVPTSPTSPTSPTNPTFLLHQPSTSTVPPSPAPPPLPPHTFSSTPSSGHHRRHFFRHHHHDDLHYPHLRRRHRLHRFFTSYRSSSATTPSASHPASPTTTHRSNDLVNPDSPRLTTSLTNDTIATMAMHTDEKQPPNPRHEPPLKRLQFELRFTVNKFRKGGLITATLMQRLRETMRDAGWFQDASQEDASELFLFLTSIFDHPYLPFQLRLFHGGNRDADDDRMTTDRLLPLCLPGESERQDEELRLESLLVDHFYNSIITGLRRQVDTPSTTSTIHEDSQDNHPSQPSTQAFVSDDSDGDSIADDKVQVTTVEFSNKSLTQEDPGDGQENEPTDATDNTNDPSLRPSTTNTSSAEEIQVDAWQAMELLPFYSSSNEQGDTIDQFQGSFPDSYLLLPIVLKRYKLQDGNFVKDNRVVSIPDTIPFKRFINQNTHATCLQCHKDMDYLLRIRSVLCHYGSSPQSGHYIAYAKTFCDQTVGCQQETWLRFDDMNVVQRVAKVKAENVFEDAGLHGYLFFYELLCLCVDCLEAPGSDSDSEHVLAKVQKDQLAPLPPLPPLPSVNTSSTSMPAPSQDLPPLPTRTQRPTADELRTKLAKRSSCRMM
ncbi:cysteine proteinase [Hesseltinella vesiculosa]|uniref:ubiquitinyl hydrolase 1 n=1 Tax=Hesseltinella vesiculosa TaxID=101127 RepID=A0A1X2GM01_9FUNG|nr:cysteine proteinase [Hesseltinella vesiculosa]